MSRLFRPLALLILAISTLGFVVAARGQELDLDRLERVVESNPEEVIPSLQLLAQESPSPRVHFLLARAWVQIDANQSLGWLEKVFETSPEHGPAWGLWADIMTSASQWEYAIVRLQQQLRRIPDSAYLHLLLAQIYVSTDDRENGEKEFQRVLEVAPQDSRHRTQALFSLGYLYVSAARFEQGTPLLKEVASRDGSYIPQLTELSKRLMEEEQWQPASQLLTHMRGLGPGDAEVSLLLGRVLMQRGLSDQAISVLTDLVEREAGHLGARFALGKAYRGRGQATQASEHFQAFTDLSRQARVERLTSAFGTDPQGLSVVQLLEKIPEHGDLQANIFLNRERASLFQVKAGLEEDPAAKIGLWIRSARELVHAGLNEEAIGQISQVRNLLKRRNIAETDPVFGSLRELTALAYLRLGERENCLARHTADSCIMPIAGDGIHRLERGSRRAIREFTALLETRPRDLGYRWLLNLAYMTLGEYPDKVPSPWLIAPSVFRSGHDIGRFHNIAPALGVNADGLAGGSIVEDFDGDGNLDIMVSSWGLKDQLRYFHNNGDGTFVEWTEKAGLVGQWGGLNMLHADYNNDGYADVLVLRGGWLDFLGDHGGDHPNSLLHNNGDGTFSDVTKKSGLLSFQPTQTAAWADYDLDGWLDLFIGNESVGEYIHPCQLFRNNGDGTFAEVALKVGLDETGVIKGVTWGDYDNDGYPDLYLSRFDSSNLLYRNDGPSESGWSFTEVTKKAGVEGPQLSFPAWFWDYDNDGWEDLFVASFASYFGNTLDTVVADYLDSGKAEFSRLYHNNRDGTFRDVTQQVGLDAVLVTMGANFGDLDNDGFLDCYLGTGQPDMMTLIPNRMFRNAGGNRFQDVTTSGGFGHLQKGHGISFGDLDNDGDQDIYAALGGFYSGDSFQNALFENPGHSNHWITLRLEGEKSNRFAVGARVKVNLITEEGDRAVHVTVGTGGSFGSSSLQQEIGLGQAKAIQSIEILWPNRERKPQIIRDVPTDRIVRIRQGEAKVEVVGN